MYIYVVHGQESNNETIDYGKQSYIYCLFTNKKAATDCAMMLNKVAKEQKSKRIHWVETSYAYDTMPF